MDKGELQAWLRRYSNYNTYVNHLQTEREALELELLSAPISKQDGTPRASGVSDRTANSVVRLDMLDRIISEAEQNRDCYYSEISGAISRIDGKDWVKLRAVLRLRYLQGLSWPELCGELFVDKSDFLEHEDSYMRATFRLHRRALDALSEIVPTEGQNAPESRHNQ